MNCPMCSRPLRIDKERNGPVEITLLICDHCAAQPADFERAARNKRGLVGMTHEPNATHDTITDLLSRVSGNPTAQTAAAVALNLFSLNCWTLFGKGLTEEQLQTGIQNERNKLAHNLRQLVEGREEF